MQIIIYMKVFTGPHISITQWHWQWRTTFFWPKTFDYLSNFGLVWQVSWWTNFLRLTPDETQRSISSFREKNSCATLVLHLLHCYGSFDWNKKYSLKIGIEKSSDVQNRGIANKFSQYFNMIAGVPGSFASNCGYLRGDDF